MSGVVSGMSGVVSGMSCPVSRFWCPALSGVSCGCPAMSRPCPALSRPCPAMSRPCPAHVPPCPAPMHVFQISTNTPNAVETGYSAFTNGRTRRHHVVDKHYFEFATLSLQTSLSQWHRSSDVVHVMCSQAQFVCMQVGDRLRAEQPQWPEMLDPDFRLTLPHLVDDTGVPSADNVEWRAYQVSACVLRKGSQREHGHCQAMLFSSSGVYLCDDGRSAKLLNDDEATQELQHVYMIWVVHAPDAQVLQSWTCQSDDATTAMTSQASLLDASFSIADLLQAHFG